MSKNNSGYEWTVFLVEMSFLDESTVFLAENSDAYVMKLEGNSFEEPIFVKRFTPNVCLSYVDLNDLSGEKRVEELMQWPLKKSPDVLLVSSLKNVLYCADVRSNDLMFNERVEVDDPDILRKFEMKQNIEKIVFVSLNFPHPRNFAIYHNLFVGTDHVDVWIANLDSCEFRDVVVVNPLTDWFPPGSYSSIAINPSGRVLLYAKETDISEDLEVGIIEDSIKLYGVLLRSFHLSPTPLVEMALHRVLCRLPEDLQHLVMERKLTDPEDVFRFIFVPDNLPLILSNRKKLKPKIPEIE